MNLGFFEKCVFIVEFVLFYLKIVAFKYLKILNNGLQFSFTQFSMRKILNVFQTSRAKFNSVRKYIHLSTMSNQKNWNASKLSFVRRIRTVQETVDFYGFRRLGYLPRHFGPPLCKGARTPPLR